MASTCSRAALRLLISILLVSSIVTAAVVRLPPHVHHHVSRGPGPVEVATTHDTGADRKSFFQKLGDFISNYIASIFAGKDDDENDADEAATTILIEPTPIEFGGKIQTIFVTPRPIVELSSLPIPSASASPVLLAPALTSSSLGQPSSASYPVSSSAYISESPFIATIVSELPSNIPSLTTGIQSSAALGLSSNVTVSSTSSAVEVSETSSAEFHILPFPYPIATTAVELGLPTDTIDIDSPIPTQVNSEPETVSPTTFEVPTISILPYPLLNATSPDPVLTPIYVLSPRPSLFSPIESSTTDLLSTPEEPTEEGEVYRTIVYTRPPPSPTQSVDDLVEIISPYPHSLLYPPRPSTNPIAVTSHASGEPVGIPSLTPSTVVLVESDALGNLTTVTMTVRRTSTVFLTATLPRVPVTGSSAPPEVTMIPLWLNSTVVPGLPISPSGITPTSILASLDILTPTSAALASPPASSPSIDTPLITNTTVNFTPRIRTSLSKICESPSIHTITLPLISTFYGPNAYPSLHNYPGCKPPSTTSSQAIRAPGLLNCTALGTEVQACQKLGKRILLTVRGSGGGAVGGNLGYGKPGSDPEPYGPTYEDSGLGYNDTILHLPVVTPNLFDGEHPPTALALTLFSLFGEGHTERADLRPLGPNTPNSASPDGIRWLSRPLGKEVVVDGFDVQVPMEWKGKYQADQFAAFAERLRELNDAAWKETDKKKGGAEDLGADGKGVVLQGWV